MIVFPSNPVRQQEFTDGNNVVWICQDSTIGDVRWARKSVNIEEAPIDGSTYGRKDGAWVVLP